MDYYLRHLHLGRITAAAFGDALALVAASLIAYSWMSAPFSLPVHAAVTAVGVALCFAALFYCDAYRPEILTDSYRTRMAIVATMGIAFVVALAVYFLVPMPRAATQTLAITAACYFPLLLGGRALFRSISALPRLRKRMLIVGQSELGVEIADIIRGREKLGFELVGFLSDESQEGPFQAPPNRVLGKVHEIEKLVDVCEIGIIVVASKNRDEYFPAEELLATKMQGLKVESGVDFYERLTGSLYLRDLRPSYLVFSDGFRHSARQRRVKRALDIVGSAFALTLAIPALGLCALAIRLDSKGPILYRQERVGLGGRRFYVTKLRSMRVDAEKGTGPVFANRADDRVTRVGRFLRMSRLDEVPQLWNVLMGDMSLVGPRPERPEFVDLLCQRYPYFRWRSAAKPGVTGWAQIRHGYVNEMEGFEQKLAHDLYYIKHGTLGMDLLILWQTVKTVLLFRGL